MQRTTISVCRRPIRGRASELAPGVEADSELFAIGRQAGAQ